MLGPAKQIDVKNFSKAIGPVDNMFNKFMKTLGIDTESSKVRNLFSYAAVRNAIFRSNNGTAVSASEAARSVDEIGTAYKNDKSVMIQLAGAFDNMIQRMSTVRDSAPAFYSKNLKVKVENLGKIRDSLLTMAKATVGQVGEKTTKAKATVGQVGEKATTKPKVVYVEGFGQVKFGQIIKGKDGSQIQLTGLDSNGQPKWKVIK